MPVVRKKKKCPKLLRVVLLLMVLFTIGLIWVQNYDYFFGEKTGITGKCSRGQNIAIIKIHGDIVTYEGDDYFEGRDVVSSERVVDYINQANQDKKIKAIIVDIDSFGGSAVAAEEMANALKKAKKPTIAIIRGVGDSAAYLAATGSQRIYASQFSEIGNIGITMSYLDYSQKNIAEGVTYQELASGQFKDIGNPNKPLTEEEKELLLKYVGKLKQAFVGIVSENRNIDFLKVQEMANGAIFFAQEAKTKGLIDEIGGIEEVKEYLRNQLNIEPQLCYLE